MPQRETEGSPGRKPVAQDEIGWSVSPDCGLSSVRAAFGVDEYAKQKNALKKVLVAYFNSGDRNCTQPQGKTINPIGSHPAMGKILKVRWMLPGGGKSGGLRLAIVAFCEAKQVEIALAVSRSSGPSVDDLRAAGEGAPPPPPTATSPDSASPRSPA